jgi:hypothetical protein
MRGNSNEVPNGQRDREELGIVYARAGGEEIDAVVHLDLAPSDEAGMRRVGNRSGSAWLSATSAFEGDQLRDKAASGSRTISPPPRDMLS